MTPEELLQENDRRLAENNKYFDPVTGEGSTGERCLLEVEGLDRCFVPVKMMEEPEIHRLVQAGSVDKFLMAKHCRTITRRDREVFAAHFRRVRMLHDFPYWAASHAYIKNKRGGEDILFRLNRPQKKLVEKLESMRLADCPIRLILLKARQWGGSTYTLSYYILPQSYN